jgi:hypothetical protein
VQLPGSYDLMLVTTNRPSPVTLAHLRLWPNPRERQARLGQLGYRRGARPIAGVTEYPGAAAYAGAADRWTTSDAPATELLDSVLYLGSPDPTDAIYTALHIERLSPAGFWGRFDSSEGFSIVVDSVGHELHPGVGLFCALRSGRK